MTRRWSGATIAALAMTSTLAVAPLAWASAFSITATITTSGTSAPAYANGFIVQSGSSNVYLFDATSNTLAYTISTPGVSSPQGNVVVGSTVYIANQGSNSVTIVNTAAHTASVLSTPTCSGPERLINVSTRIYVTCTGNAKVIVIDSSTNTVSTTLSVGQLPRRLSYAGGYVYVPNENSNTVSVITDSATPSVAANVAVGTMPVGSAGYGTRAYVVNFTGNSVSVLEGTLVIATIPVGSSPQQDVACGDYIVVGNRSDGSATFIDPVTNSVSRTVTGVGGSVTHAVQANAGIAYFGDYSANTVAAVDCASGALAGSITVSGPADMAFKDSDLGYFPAYYSSPINVASLPAASAGGGAGSSATSSEHRPWMRQVGRSAGQACEAGWGQSWAEWPNGYTGGWVCTQSLVWSSSRNEYIAE